MKSVSVRIAEELSARESQVIAAIALLDAGSTIPFIARYRKEMTGGLDDAQLRTLDERVRYLRELEERRETVLKSVEEQGKLTDTLRVQILEAETKARLEDLYLPYKPKRRTKAQIAREAGLEPLVDMLLSDPDLTPQDEAVKFVDSEKGIADVAAVLEGTRQIMAERFAEDADLVGTLRERMWSEGLLASVAVEEKKREGAKFSDYFDHREPIARTPGHRALAMFRGRDEGVLRLALTHPDDTGSGSKTAGMCERAIAAHFRICDRGRPADAWLAETVRWCWRIKLGLHIEMDLMGRLREAAEEEAIRIFAANLRNLLLAAPAGMRPTLALDPGFRTGVKVAVVDGTGKLVETAVIYPHEPHRQWDQSLAVLGALVIKHKVSLVAIGNGTASRETDRMVQELISHVPSDLKPIKVVVSEAGASVYSASAFASKEFPDLDVSLRGAVSIGRRLQDPLAELVKIDPKSIGVGQYQHDVNQSRLARALDAVVEDCVNAVGVDLNTASSLLLARVSGVGERVADNIVAYRDTNGPFPSRKDLLKVAGLGPKTFEQCAGFLRIRGGVEPLDASAVHPESYPVVERILKAANSTIFKVIGDVATLRDIRPENFADETFGVPTVTDILRELEKPGRDPRPEFRTAVFKDGIEKLSDLRPGMILEGIVTNVAAFGAFVDIGVHQDGLVHVSQLADRFVKDPHGVVKAGDIITVKVVEIDLGRQRIGLSCRLHETPEPSRASDARSEAGKEENGARGGKGRSPRAAKPGGGKPKRNELGQKSSFSTSAQGSPFGGAMAEALRKAGFGKT